MAEQQFTISPLNAPLVQRRYGLLALVLLAAHYGLFAPLSKIISSELLPLQQLAVRILLAALLASLVLRRHLSPSAIKAISKNDWKLMMFHCAFSFPPEQKSF